MCMVDEGEPADLAVVREIRARKPRKCDECQGPIRVGDLYRRSKFLYDDYWSSFAMCEGCLEGAARWLTKECGGYLCGGVEEDLYEHWLERFNLGISNAEIIGLGRLVVEMRRRRAQRPAA